MVRNERVRGSAPTVRVSEERKPRPVTESLLQQIDAGDALAMRRCIDRYGGLVFALARRWSADVAEAEDAVQEVFISLWQSAGRFDPAQASESTFVTMIARRRLIDRNRRLARVKKTEVLDEEIQDPTPSADLAGIPDAERAVRALGELGADQRNVLKLSIYGGLTHHEIAEKTGLPLGTVKTHARRGLIRIREKLSAVVERPPREEDGS